jgi:hypothetical protein
MRSIRGVVLLSVSVVLVVSLAALTAPTPGTAETLAARDGLHWYKGNLHTHSHWSDGDDYLEMIAAWYQEHDYDFLCFTDHNVLADSEKWVAVERTKGGMRAFEKLKARFADWVDVREQNGILQVRLKTFQEVAERFNSPGQFLLIQGEEISDKFERRPIHLNASNVQELIPPMKGGSVVETIQNNVNAVIAQRERTGVPILVHLNHPNFGYAVTAEELMQINGEKFFEVYNGHAFVYNSGDDHHASTERIWDIVLTWRLAELGLPIMYGLGVDDGHEYHEGPTLGLSQPGRGWVMVLARELTAESLIASLEAGRFYATSGVQLKRVVSSDRGLNVEVDAEPGVGYTIEFIGTRRGFDAHHEPVTHKEGVPVQATHRYSDDVGETFLRISGTEGRYQFSGDEFYVRARVISNKRHPNPAEPGEFELAWCQPVLGPASSNRRHRTERSPER